MTRGSGVRRGLVGVALVAGTTTAVVVAWVVGFAAWADGRTPADLALPDHGEDPTLLLQWLLKGATVGTAYAFVTFAAICAVVAAVALAARRRPGTSSRPEQSPEPPARPDTPPRPGTPPGPAEARSDRPGAGLLPG
jgi:hypothetical protein